MASGKRPFVLVLALVAIAVAPLRAQSAADNEETPASAALVFWNRPIFEFRASLGRFTPKERAAAAERRLLERPRSLRQGEVKAEKGRLGDLECLHITIDSYTLFSIFPDDLDPHERETLQQTGARVVARLTEALQARTAQRSLPRLLRSLGHAALATLAMIAAAWAIVRIRRRLAVVIEGRISRATLKAFGLDLRDEILAVQRVIGRLLILALWIAVFYLWITYVFSLFPYTEPWADTFGTGLLAALRAMGAGAVGWLPSLGTITLILLGCRVITRVVGGLFQAAESGAVSIPWLHPETVRATRRIVVSLVWVLGLVFAYPYLPGSGTVAFQGITALFGLMISLGSSGVVNQAMSGLVVLYSRVMKVGEYVRVGEIEGVVTELGVLSVRIATPRKEEIAIPNSVLVTATTTNYSRLADAEGAVVPTSVTIGYDVPWRQVHALLLLAAERTPGVRKEPRPRVLQRVLGDFYVEYELRIRVDAPQERTAILSALHAQIQDAFNEFGVQIMSPHFESQPPQRVIVPKGEWSAPPASSSPEREGRSGAGASREEEIP